MPDLERRALLALASSAVFVFPAMASAGSGPTIHVVKGTGCECCNAGVSYLKEQGFSVSDEERYGTLLIRFKMDLGLPAEVFSCHTGVVEGYALEGHVPAVDIRRLLDERPDAIGLAVPGMPYGSPGMGPETEREAHDVLLIARDGTASIFTHYPAA